MLRQLRFLRLLLAGAFFFGTFPLAAQVTLPGSGTYTQNFDGIGTSLPTGWSVLTGATATSLGTSTTYTTAATSWSGTSGGFRNFASGDIGMGGDQSTATDRALGIRQTGGVGDPGAAFAVRLANTTGAQSLSISFKLQSLDASSPRTTAWRVDYGLGAAPTSFVQAPASFTTGGSSFGNSTITVSFGSALDNQPGPVWIRIVALAVSTGSGNRPTSAIDDFALTYRPFVASAPRITLEPATSPTLITSTTATSPIYNYTVATENLTVPSLTVVVSAPFEIQFPGAPSWGRAFSTTTPPNERYEQPVQVRLRGNAAPAGVYSGTLMHRTADGVVLLPITGIIEAPGAGGQVGPCGTSQSIQTARLVPNGQVVTVSGRLTVAGQFANGRNYYIQDATGGIAIFDNPDNRGFEYTVGDLVQVRGTTGAFNLDKQITPACVGRIGTDNVPVVPTPVSLSALCNYQGQLVSLSAVSFSTAAGTSFQGNTNYTLVGSSAQVRVYNTTTLVGALRPTGPTNITGVVGVFNQTCQLLPRFVSDVSGATANSGASCGVASITPDAKALNVVTWNTEWLGHPLNGPAQSGPNDATQITNVGTMLRRLNADVFMLQEVSQYDPANPASTTTAFGQLIADLNGQFGPNAYSGECSSAVSGSVSDPNPQRVCIIYRNAVVTKLNSRVLLTTAGTDYPGGNPSQFWASGRKPFLFSAQVNLGNGIAPRTVRFVGIHAKAGSDAASHARRLYDTRALYDTLNAQFPNDLIIVGGDLNDDLDASIHLPNGIDPAISSYRAFLYASTSETAITGTRPNPNFEPISKALSDAGCATTANFPDAIDHLIVSNELAAAYVANSLTRITPILANFANTTSDHYPVYAKFNLLEALPKQPLATVEQGDADMRLMGNPINGQDIVLSVRNMSGATYCLRSLTGQTIPTQVRWQTDREVHLQLGQSVAAGTYLLDAQTDTVRRVLKVIVR